MKHCLYCFFFRVNEKKEEYCSKGYDLERVRWDHAERCEHWREDKCFTRLQYPPGETPEEHWEKVRAEALEKLEGVKE